ncbi:hypothetical protein C0991_008354 [Blastosporella zonata]|nr:hypothetical protein C0991_008354 [Blastosporella zonata]
MPVILSPRPTRPNTAPPLAIAFCPKPKPRRATASLCSTPVPSPHPCTTRRRAKPYSTRRRSSQRATAIHPFDQLPWIGTLDRAPDSLDDIADLSQIPDPPSSPSVRRPTARPPLPDLIPSPPPRVAPSRPSSPLCDTPPFLLRLPSNSRPTTPLSRFLPSRVLFHNLMPVLCESPYNESAHDPPVLLACNLR